MNTVSTTVLIVGAGPVGLVSALLLEQLGIDYLIVEKNPTLHQAPQAHVISSRTLEICRSLAISDHLIREAGPHPADTSNIRWVDRLLGRDLGTFSLASDLPAIEHLLANTPTPTTNLSQDSFEHLLFNYLATPEKLHFEHRWQNYNPTPQGYASTVINSENQTITMHSRYIIGADGAGSLVRRAIGAEMQGPDNLQTFVNIHFSANMRKHLQGREGLLYWVMDNTCEGIFIAHDIDSNWIFMTPIDDDESTTPIDFDKFAALLNKAIGTEIDLTINSMNSWRMTAQISDTYQAGNIFLVGDAAHRFPPTGGIGMNTGFQDAHNLAWKIALVEKGFDASLLESYGPERKPVAEINSAQSLNNSLKMIEVAIAIDADGDEKISMNDIDTTLNDPTRRAQVQSTINDQSAHFNMSGLDLGFCYTSSAVLYDGEPPISENSVSYYVASTTPGARLPHAWLLEEGRKISTLDLVKCGRFLVMSTAPNLELEQAVNKLSNRGYAIDLVTISADTKIKSADDSFMPLFGNTVLLVRPDGHIAARIEPQPAAEKIHQIISTLFPAKY